jgi:AraC family transcriptional regulator
LSQAVFDIQNGGGSILDISLKYRYESQAAFARAFRELHGQTPSAAKKNGITFKTYPRITFKFIIKGVTEMDFRIEKKESFKIIGYKSGLDWDEWRKFFDRYHQKLYDGGYYKSPFWQIWAFILPLNYDYEPFKEHPECSAIVGAEYNGEPLIEGLEIEEYPAATWAVFPVVSDTANDATGKTYAKAMTEWLPLSNFTRNENLPFLEVYPTSTAPGEVRYDEVWVPVLGK